MWGLPQRMVEMTNYRSLRPGAHKDFFEVNDPIVDLRRAEFESDIKRLITRLDRNHVINWLEHVHGYDRPSAMALFIRLRNEMPKDGE